VYQKYISPLKTAPSCRFYPTCSQYAADAVEEWGVFVGLLLAAWRLLRCNPFSRGGFDYVPKKH
jgi:putative membrane protein insertion efficiency factor